MTFEVEAISRLNELSSETKECLKDKFVPSMKSVVEAMFRKPASHVVGVVLCVNRRTRMLKLSARRILFQLICIMNIFKLLKEQFLKCSCFHSKQRSCYECDIHLSVPSS